VLATATCCTGEMPAQIAEIAQPGTSLVFYMAMQQLAVLTAQLLGAGVAADQPVTVMANVSKPGERCVHTTVARLAVDCQVAQVRNPAVIMVKLAKAASLAVCTSAVTTQMA
jgi:uroporphyrin-III C-methyltransferase